MNYFYSSFKRAVKKYTQPYPAESILLHGIRSYLPLTFIL